MAKGLFSFLARRPKTGIPGFEANPSPQLVFDKETLRILAANDAAVALYGYTEEEFLVMTIREIRPVWELQKLARHISEQHLQGKNTGIWKHLKKSGEVILVKVDAEDVVYKDVIQRIVTIEDITPRQ